MSKFTFEIALLPNDDEISNLGKHDSIYQSIVTGAFVIK
jgi:hypothetical protein